MTISKLPTFLDAEYLLSSNRYQLDLGVCDGAGVENHPLFFETGEDRRIREPELSDLNITAMRRIFKYRVGIWSKGDGLQESCRDGQKYSRLASQAASDLGFRLAAGADGIDDRIRREVLLTGTKLLVMSSLILCQILCYPLQSPLVGVKHKASTISYPLKKFKCLFKGIFQTSFQG